MKNANQGTARPPEQDGYGGAGGGYRFVGPAPMQQQTTNRPAHLASDAAVDRAYQKALACGRPCIQIAGRIVFDAHDTLDPRADSMLRKIVRMGFHVWIVCPHTLPYDNLDVLQGDMEALVPDVFLNVTFSKRILPHTMVELFFPKMYDPLTLLKELEGRYVYVQNEPDPYLAIINACQTQVDLKRSDSVPVVSSNDVKRERPARSPDRVALLLETMNANVVDPHFVAVGREAASLIREALAAGALKR